MAELVTVEFESAQAGASTPPPADDFLALVQRDTLFITMKSVILYLGLSRH
jgi:hypothetical protein